MTFEISISGSLLCIDRDGRTVLYLTRDEAFELLDKIKEGLWQMPSGPRATEAPDATRLAGEV